MIQNGAVLTYIGIWDLSVILASDPSFSGSDAQDEIVAALSVSGLVVQNFSAFFDGTTVPLAPMGIDLGSINFPSSKVSVAMQLAIQNGQGFNSVDDVLKLVRAGVQTIIGTTPSGDSIPYDQEPGATPKKVVDPNCPCNFSDLFVPGGCCSVSQWFSNLETSALWLIGIVFIVGIAGIFLISEGKKRVLA